MIIKSIPSSWLTRTGRRLDCGPYTSGALEARIRLESLRSGVVPLSSVTRGGLLGIYHAGREGRTWVDDPEHGVPFLSSSSILAADLSNLPLISRKQVQQNPLFTLRKGWTLITRSGTIGRMVYCRPDMDGLACSEHVMRVVPDSAKIPPGYLYAYLSSRFGVPQVVSGTYGSIIQSIEPQHIADLPVPRLGEALERQVHELVEEAGRLRASASQILNETPRLFQSELGLRSLVGARTDLFGVTEVRSVDLNQRLDATYHSRAAHEAEAAIRDGIYPVKRLIDCVRRYFKPPLFKRLWVDSGAHGCQFISGVDAYRLQAENQRFVSFRTPEFDQFVVETGWVIFQAAGQIYGLFGQPLLVAGWLEGLFCADDLYRLVPNSVEDGAWLYGYLRTPHGSVLLKRQASGNSIPRVWDPHIRDIVIPWPDQTTRHRLAEPILHAHQLRESARLSERRALHMVERAIEEAS